MAERMIAVRAFRTDTAACCSSALAASLADSLSTSMELPSACVTPTEESACVVNAVCSTADLASECPAPRRGPRGSPRRRGDSRASKRWRGWRQALRDAGQRRKCCAQAPAGWYRSARGTELLEGRGGGPSLDLTRSILGAHSLYRRLVQRPLGSRPDSARQGRAGRNSDQARAIAEHEVMLRGRRARVAAHGGRAAVHAPELLEREGTPGRRGRRGSRPGARPGARGAAERPRAGCRAPRRR